MSSSRNSDPQSGFLASWSPVVSAWSLRVSPTTTMVSWLPDSCSDLQKLVSSCL